MSVFQYAKSTDPEVIEIVAKNHADRRDAVDRVLAWAKERGATNASVIWLGLGFTVTELRTPPTGFGQWTTGNPSRPFKSNRAELEAMRDLKWMPAPVPGVVIRVTHGKGSGFSYRETAARPFVSKGAAWVGFGSIPDKSPASHGPQWVEVLASEYQTALEAVES